MTREDEEPSLKPKPPAVTADSATDLSSTINASAVTTVIVPSQQQQPSDTEPQPNDEGALAIPPGGTTDFHSFEAGDVVSKIAGRFSELGVGQTVLEQGLGYWMGLGQGMVLPAMGQGMCLPKIGQALGLSAIGQGNGLTSMGYGMGLPTMGQAVGLSTMGQWMVGSPLALRNGCGSTLAGAGPARTTQLITVRHAGAYLAAQPFAAQATSPKPTGAVGQPATPKPTAADRVAVAQALAVKVDPDSWLSDDYDEPDTGVKLPGHRDGTPGQCEGTGTPGPDSGTGLRDRTPGRDNGTASEVSGTPGRDVGTV